MSSVSLVGGIKDIAPFAMAKKGLSLPKDKSKKRVSDVAFSYLKSTKGVQALVIRPTTLSLDTIKWWNSGLSKGGKNLYDMTKTTSNFLTISSFPLTVNSFAKAISTAKDALSKKKSYKDVIKVSAKAGLSAMGLTVAAGNLVQSGSYASLYDLSARTITHLKRLGIAGKIAFLAGMIWDGFKERDKIIESNREKEKILLSSLKIVEKAVIGTSLFLGILCFFVGLSVAAWILICLSALGLSLSIGTYFYEQVQNPYGKKLSF